MSGKSNPKISDVRVFPPPPKGFDALGATKRDLARHGIPQRPDPKKRPGMAALWEQHARRYRDFEHLETELVPGTTTTPIREASCGYKLTSFRDPFVMLSGTWTVPNLNFSAALVDPIDFTIFFYLGDVFVHVAMTVDSAQNVAARTTIGIGRQGALPVSAGDVISAVLCLDPDPTVFGPEGTGPGRAFYFLANETTSQTVMFSMGPNWAPAVEIGAGISRAAIGLPPGPIPLARFGAVYFDEIAAYTTSGTRSLTDGVATPMINEPFGDGSILARTVRINDLAFKIVRQGA